MSKALKISISNDYNKQMGQFGEDPEKPKCNLLPEDSFDDYNLDDYLNDVENDLQKDYTEDISRFKKRIEPDDHSLDEIKCAGFCEVR